MLVLTVIGAFYFKENYNQFKTKNYTFDISAIQFGKYLNVEF